MTYLYLIILTTTMSTDLVRRFEFPSMAECQSSLKLSKIDNGKDRTVAMFCASEKNERHYGTTWWTDKSKVSKD